MTAPNDVVITGIGLLTSLGEGVEANWAALRDFTAPVIDSERFAPYTVHPLPEVDWSQQIAKRGDQRQMEAWQRIGTYSAGLALEDAGIKGNEALCASMDMIVAAGGGERDVDVDTMILKRIADGASDIGVAINEVLTTELRPTLFLAQLSNLLAGNISIVHKVTGSSRTFMGEEGAGILLYLNQEGRGIGLANKMRAYSLQDQGFDTVEANHRLGFEDDERDFRIGAEILKRLGFSRIRLLTNNPNKVARMSEAGIAVEERVPLKVGRGLHNHHYLATKAAKSGHLL